MNTDKKKSVKTCTELVEVSASSADYPNPALIRDRAADQYLANLTNILAARLSHVRTAATAAAHNLGHLAHQVARFHPFGD